jgi:hypothetical protein
MKQLFAPKPEVEWDRKIFESSPKSPIPGDTGKEILDRYSQKISTKGQNISRGKIAQLPATRNFKNDPSPQLLKPSRSVRASPLPFPTAVINNVRASTPVKPTVRQDFRIF